MNEQSSVHHPPGDLPIPKQLSESEGFHQWLYQLIRPALKGKVLEVGSAMGNICSLLIQDGFALRISDPDRLNCEHLLKRFNEEPAIKGILHLDTSNPAFETTYTGLFGKFDTVVSINYTDQGSNNPLNLNNAKRLLRDRGRLIAVLAAHIALYGESEPGFGYWRRSNRKDIRARLGKDCEILHTQFFTISAIPQMLEAVYNQSLPETDQDNKYYQYVPAFGIIEDATFSRTGLYVLVIARKLS